MGISLGDIASFATGVVDADTAATQERLKDRRAELQADRQLYIDMKTKKYESELKSFEAENKKYKAIQSVNSKFEGSETPVIPSDYGKAYLMETNPQLLLQYQTLYKENPNELNKVLSIIRSNLHLKDVYLTVLPHNYKKFLEIKSIKE